MVEGKSKIGIMVLCFHIFQCLVHKFPETLQCKVFKARYLLHKTSSNPRLFLFDLFLTSCFKQHPNSQVTQHNSQTPLNNVTLWDMVKSKTTTMAQREAARGVMNP